MASSHKTTALPLALAYAALIVYASLYPFAGWRDQGIEPWAFVTAPWPKYWTGFDVGINIAGYVPYGFFGALVVLRTWPRWPTRYAVGGATLAGVAISFAMETLQNYLPSRIPSNVDWALNSLGTLVGASLAAGLERLGLLTHWERVRTDWFLPEARGALGLLLLWPVALLYPAAVTFGLGQVFERLETATAELLADTPFLDWLPVRQFELQPLMPLEELLCVLLGALVPCLLAFVVARAPARRAWLLPMVLIVGVAASALSAALSWGPEHAWAWLSTSVYWGVAGAALIGALLLAAPRRWCAALALVAVMVHLVVLNQAPESAYFAQTLATWEQGRFIRLYGLGQWLGWLWPFVTLGYLLRVLTRARSPS